MTRPTFFQALVQMLGIVLFRFRPLPHLWALWLISVNGLGLLFVTRIEAQVLLAATVVAVSAMALSYQRIGYTRVLGVAHVVWLPVFAWLATRLETIAADPALAKWLALTLATNCVCLVIDACDIRRFLRGERAPHYYWARHGRQPIGNGSIAT